MKTCSYLASILLFYFCLAIQAQKTNSKDFSFAFMTDIHLQKGMGAVEGFNMAIDTLNKLNAEFLLTGGDLIEHGKMGQADTMFRLYNKVCKRVEIPIYNTIGNHDCFSYTKHGHLEEVALGDRKKLFEKYIGKRYNSFDHKGWHFMILDALYTYQDSTGKIFDDISMIDSIQMEWIKKDLAKVDASSPVVLCTHIPFLNSRISLNAGFDTPIGRQGVINNRYEVLALFNNHNLKLILQGHLHNLDDINMTNKVRFITGGAVCANWWRGPTFSYNPLFKMEEGFLMIHIINDEISWDYIDYGWEALKK